MRGVPECIRSDNGAEMTATVVRNWLTQLRPQQHFRLMGSPPSIHAKQQSTGRSEFLLAREVGIERGVTAHRQPRLYSAIRRHAECEFADARIVFGRVVEAGDMRVALKYVATFDQIVRSRSKRGEK